MVEKQLKQLHGKHCCFYCCCCCCLYYLFFLFACLFNVASNYQYRGNGCPVTCICFKIKEISLKSWLLSLDLSRCQIMAFCRVMGIKLTIIWIVFFDCKWEIISTNTLKSWKLLRKQQATLLVILKSNSFLLRNRTLSRTSYWMVLRKMLKGQL